MTRVTLRSPAKINLYLKVINKRPDGYHNIHTLFERVNLFDEINFISNMSGKIRIRCNSPDVPLGPKNLVYKVAKLLQEKEKVKKGVDIRIHKRIPVAAGLAGGSSNAATALLGLNKIWGLKLSQSQIVSYARQIGSDVAFFLYDTAFALGTKRGDEIKKVYVKSTLWHVLVVPRIKMYSFKVYGGLRLQSTPSTTRKIGLTKAATLSRHDLIESKKNSVGDTNMLTKKDDNVNILIRYLREGNLLKVSRLLSNDLETEIIRLCPALLKLKDRLKSLKCEGVMISGSGPCVFGLTSTEKEAKRIQSIFSKRFSQVFVVKTL